MQHADQLVADARTVANATSSSPLLDVSDLTVTFPGAAGPVQVVRGLSYSIARGETLGIVACLSRSEPISRSETAWESSSFET